MSPDEQVRKLRKLGLSRYEALAYLALAVRYWFRTPLIGIALASVCFLAAAIVLSV